MMSGGKLMKAVFMTDTEADVLDQIRDHLGGSVTIDQVSRKDTDAMTSKAADYDIAVGGLLPREFLAAATRLKYVIIPYAGVNAIDRGNLAEYSEITVLNSHYNTVPAAEHAWGLLLTAAKWISHFDSKLRIGDWTGRYGDDCSFLLSGKRMLLIGYGALGKRLGKMGDAFDMTVAAIKRTPGAAPELAFIGTRDDLHDQLPQSDVVMITLPGTDHTAGYLGEAEFAAMKNGVLLINIGRGGAIDEQAFYNAMLSGKIGAAGIDTWWQYPTSVAERSSKRPSQFQLEQFENLVMSPHRAAHIAERNVAWVTDMAAILRSIANGSPINVVDPVHWY
jgi:phosphoglycerate dehydrogenase-like enzyme